MGYSQSKETLEGMLELLEPISQGQQFCSWTVTNYPHKFAYKLREALYIASLYPSEYPELARSYKEYKIVVYANGIVVAERRKGIQAVINKLEKETPKPVFLGNDAVEDQRQQSTKPAIAAFGNIEITDSNASTIFKILEAWMYAQARPSMRSKTMAFPRARLSEIDIAKLKEWANKRQWLVIIPTAENPLILTPKPQN